MNRNKYPAIWTSVLRIFERIVKHLCLPHIQIQSHNNDDDSIIHPFSYNTSKQSSISRQLKIENDNLYCKMQMNPVYECAIQLLPNKGVQSKYKIYEERNKLRI